MEEYKVNTFTERPKKRKTVTKKGGFTNTRIEQLLYNAGAEYVSNKAVILLNEILTEKGTKIAEFAIEVARYVGRETLIESDILVATFKVF